MKIYEINARHFDLSAAMKAFIEKKLERLDAVSADVVDAKVLIAYSGSHNERPHKVEIQLNLPNIIIRAEERSHDAYLAIDAVVKKLERQLKKYHGRKQGKRKEARPELEFETTQNEPQLLFPGISRVKKHILRPMSPEDAVFQLEYLGHSFYMFRNSLSKDIGVVYVRHDGTYGLLQAAD